MISNMEKFINFKQLRVVKTGTTTSSGAPGLTLTDGGALFTQSVLPNAIVWDRTTNGSNGGEMYLVNTVTSDTELAEHQAQETALARPARRTAPMPLHGLARFRPWTCYRFQWARAE